MGWPDEEHIIQMLRQIKQEVPPPRQEWKQIGKEKLLRQTRRVLWTQKAVRTVSVASTFTIAMLVGVWISLGSSTQTPNDSQWGQSPSQGEQVETLPQSALPAGQDEVDKEAVPLPKGEKQHTNQPSVPNIRQQPNQSRNQATLDKPSSTTAVISGSSGRENSIARNKTRVEEQAVRFLREKLGEKSTQYEVDIVHSRPDDGQIAFRKVIAGIPQQESSLLVKVDEENGEMSMLFYPGQEQDATKNAQAPAADRIEENVAAKELAATLRLVYVANASRKLQYMSDPYTFIDAKSGKQVRSKQGEKVVLAATGKGKQVTIKDGEQGAQLLANEFGFTVSGNGFMRAEKKGFSFTWSPGEGGSMQLFTDEDGIFTGYEWRGAAEKQNSDRLTTDQAQEVALNQLKNYLPSQIHEVSVEEARHNGGETRFTFVPLIQGIPVIDVPYRVTVELASGKVISMTGEFAQEFALPHKTDALSEQEISTHFVKTVPLELVYWAPDSESDPILVYQIPRSAKQPWSQDAKTGEVIK
ncbi:YcdB/YcdC domain-containing protein [Brevibacillus reuszeri]|uniref:YcdB/YcdC domain-containing protein n=1 Tax=Brevibacillus reuszeri TaxID=54915 RepID=UPI003D1A8E28